MLKSKMLKNLCWSFNKFYKYIPDIDSPSYVALECLRQFNLLSLTKFDE